MTAWYEFLTGPAFVLSLGVFVCGMAIRLALYFAGLDQRLDRIAYRPHLAAGMQGGLHSIWKWLLPFATYGWRSQVFFTFCFFLLHTGAVLVPLFLDAHAMLLHKAFGFSPPSLPQGAADILTVLTLTGGGLIVLRRIALPEVRILTAWKDYGILGLVLVPFLTGLLARLHVSPYEVILLIHIVSGELLLILAPVTRLSHIVLYFASRWQIGADYAIKRGGHRRGPAFPW
jgi:nitrate reductase gamma subunit